MSKELHFTFDKEKAIEAVLYIAKHAHYHDKYHVCKIVYHADNYHLEHYLRLICNDSYAAMPYGTVPSNTYDLIKEAARGRIPEITVKGTDLIPLREPDLQVFSETDLEALDGAINALGHLGFEELDQISHADPVWKRITQDGELLKPPNIMRSIPIPLEEIVSELEERDELLEYLYEYC